MSQAPAPAKVCIVCQQDCSRRPRSRDGQGRYTCDDCARRLQEARAAGAIAPAAAAAPAPAEPAALYDEGPLAIMEDEPAPAHKPSIPCPNCQAPLGSGVMICVNCGFNRATGAKMGTSTDGKDRSKKNKAAAPGAGPMPFTCVQCGYNLAGLKSTRCPECGKINVVRSTKRERELEESRRQAKLAYIRPAIMTVVGLTIAGAFIGSQGGAILVPAYLLGFAINFVVLLGVYFVCSLVFIGFDEPFYLTALRLLGVCAVADAVWAVTAPLPIGIGKWLINAFVWVGLMVWVMEIDKEDAIIVGVVTMLVKIAVFLFILPMIL